MLDWWAARMMAWIGDLEAAGWEIIDSFPSEGFPAYDHLVTVEARPRDYVMSALPLDIRVPILGKWTTAYADGTPQECYGEVFDG